MRHRVRSKDDSRKTEEDPQCLAKEWWRWCMVWYMVESGVWWSHMARESSLQLVMINIGSIIERHLQRYFDSYSLQFWAHVSNYGQPQNSFYLFYLQIYTHTLQFFLIFYLFRGLETWFWMSESSQINRTTVWNQTGFGCCFSLVLVDEWNPRTAVRIVFALITTFTMDSDVLECTWTRLIGIIKEITSGPTRGQTHL